MLLQYNNYNYISYEDVHICDFYMAIMGVDQDFDDNSYILDKLGYIPTIDQVDFSVLQDKSSITVLKTLYNFENILKAVVDKNEPSILARYLIELSQAYSNFYNENKIIDDDKDVQNARVYLSKCVGQVLKTGASLLGIQMPNKM